ncbi:MAG: hypothetical protein QXQ14_00100 [Candidatus Aenigmatarchaeota archaeon]
MKNLSEVGIRFFIGVGIAALIGFLFWWFVIHNESDRIVERSFNKFYSALDVACNRKASKDYPEEVYIELPQKTFANVFDEFKRMIKLEEEKLPLQIFGDPYYKFYWEFFPPEPPYDILDVTEQGISGLAGTLAAVFIPWQEDLPWSSNLLFSLATYTFFLNFDLIGAKNMRNLLEKGFFKFRQELSTRIKEEILDKLKPHLKELNEIMQGVETLVKKLEKIEIYAAKVGEKIKITIKYIESGKEEVIWISKAAGFLTLVCLFTQNMTLEQCLTLSISSAVLLDVTKIISKEMVWPYFKRKLDKLYYQVKGEIKEFFLNAKDTISLRLKYFKEKLFSKDISDIEQEVTEKLDSANNLLDEYRSAIENKEWQKAKEKLEEINKKVGEIKDLLKNLPDEEEYRIRAFFVNTELDLISSEINYITKKLNENEFLELLSEGIVELEEVKGVLDKLPEEIADKPSEAALINKGFKVVENGNLYIDEGNEYFEDFKNYAEYYKQKTNKLLERLGNFRLEYDADGNLVKVIYDPEESFSKILKQTFSEPIKKYLALLEEKAFLHNKIIPNTVVKDFADEVINELIKKKNTDLELIAKIEKYSGMSLDQIINKLNNLKDKMSHSFGIVVEKDTKLANILDKLGPKANPKEVKDALREYFFEIFKQEDKKEIEMFVNLLNGKQLRIKEDLQVFFRRGAIGYSIFRYLDLNTPIGASYWDKLLSYYGYEGQKMPYGCQTECEEGKICSQLGACVRQFELPKSCQEIGIEEVRLKRDSWVAKDPRFYLVSPCYGKAQIYIEDNKIFVEVLLDKNKNPNYCYAYENYVNAYIASESSETIGRCIIASVCAVLTLGTGTAGAIKACLLGSAGPAIDHCELIADLFGIGMLTFREGVMSWPYVYKNLPELAKWS